MVIMQNLKQYITRFGVLLFLLIGAACTPKVVYVSDSCLIYKRLNFENESIEGLVGDDPHEVRVHNKIFDCTCTEKGYTDPDCD